MALASGLVFANRRLLSVSFRHP